MIKYISIPDFLLKNEHEHFFFLFFVCMFLSLTRWIVQALIQDLNYTFQLLSRPQTCTRHIHSNHYYIASKLVSEYLLAWEPSVAQFTHSYSRPFYRETKNIPMVLASSLKLEENRSRVS